MRVLLSIKPEFAERIFDGTKKYEFRKSLFKRKGIRTVVVYASSPTQKVIGEFEIEEIINDTLDELWAKTEQHAGINKDFFYKYFRDKEYGYAIKIKSFKKYKTPLNLKQDLDLTPPQSFLYMI